MALQSMDDKLLGEKPHNYCSSDEDTEDESTPSVIPERSGIRQSARRNDRAIQTGTCNSEYQTETHIKIIFG